MNEEKKKEFTFSLEVHSNPIYHYKNIEIEIEATSKEEALKELKKDWKSYINEATEDDDDIPWEEGWGPYYDELYWNEKEPDWNKVKIEEEEE